MGLFSFVKNAGEKLFGGKKTEEKPKVAPKVAPKPVEKVDKDDADASLASALEAVVKGLGLQVDGLNIRVDDDKVTVSGIAASQEVREKVILAVGNVEGIATVDDQMEVKPSDDEAAPRGVTSNSRFHTVEKGDTLSKIAKEVYGDPKKYPIIFEANKPMLQHPDKIYPGQLLRIPAL